MSWVLKPHYISEMRLGFTPGLHNPNNSQIQILLFSKESCKETSFTPVCVYGWYACPLIGVDSDSVKLWEPKRKAFLYLRVEVTVKISLQCTGYSRCLQSGEQNSCQVTNNSKGGLLVSFSENLGAHVLRSTLFIIPNLNLKQSFQERHIF